MVDLSIIIVTFNSREFLRKCLISVFNSRTNFSFDVTVSDSGSTDGTVEMVEKEFPQLQVIRGENKGFAAGNNVAIKRSSGEYILLLNPDTEVEPDTLEIMLKLMERRSD